MSQRVAESKSARLFDRSTAVDSGVEAGNPAKNPANQLEFAEMATAGASFLDLARTESSRTSSPRDRSLRALDVIGSTAGLIALMPLMLLAALAIRVGSSGPILYRQERIGRWGDPFVVLKLRTMGQRADEDLAQMLGDPHYREQWSEARKIADDPRITRVGRFLRAADFDELPQLWNVLKGEMSLVGPRPVPAEESERYRADLGTALSVRPGITGLWQVSGRNAVSYDRRISLDLTYVGDRGILLNLRLMAKTVVQLVFRRGLPQA